MAFAYLNSPMAVHAAADPFLGEKFSVTSCCAPFIVWQEYFHTHTNPGFIARAQKEQVCCYDV